MKPDEKNFYIALILVVIFSVIIGINMVEAADTIMSGKLTNVTQKVNKNGEAYTIIALPESKELNGVKYSTETSVFCFKSEPAKKLKPGDEVKFVAKRTVSKDGNEFVTLIQFLPTK